MIKRVLEISSGPARLSIAHRQLVIEREGQEKTTVPCEDIGVVLVDHPAVAYTHGVFTALAEAGAAVVLCGPKHLPSSLLLPLNANTIQTERQRAQLQASLPLKKRLWQTLVSAKLRQQAAVLEVFTGEDAGIAQLARRVRSGAPENIEAQGSQRYWPRLFGRAFRRDRDGDPPNNLLNYGYMVFRAAMARALCGAGLLPTVGLHHHNRYNPFCLADDLLEPYRPFVDWRVRTFVGQNEATEFLDREAKQALLSLFNETVEVAGRRSPLLLAMHATAASLNEAFAQNSSELALPQGLPFAAPAEEGLPVREEEADDREHPA